MMGRNKDPEAKLALSKELQHLQSLMANCKGCSLEFCQQPELVHWHATLKQVWQNNIKWLEAPLRGGLWEVLGVVFVKWSGCVLLECQRLFAKGVGSNVRL